MNIVREIEETVLMVIGILLCTFGHPAGGVACFGLAIVIAVVSATQKQW